jgi:hypothetical protein
MNDQKLSLNGNRNEHSGTNPKTGKSGSINLENAERQRDREMILAVKRWVANAERQFFFTLEEEQ